ncbi:uncharacterized protein EI90DRAFT_3035242, partial [Cantharellus anzutake]|uniref:uncharacterized protein n=1 Tax=Cantharellus anzutake TaxID=1750568 RepID=UPI0019057BA3
MQRGLVESLQAPEQAAGSAHFEDESRYILQAINLKDPIRERFSFSADRKVLLQEASTVQQTLQDEPLIPSSPGAAAPSKRPLFVHQQVERNGPYVTLLLACETCHRSEYNSLHGLFTHARSHGLHYRNHDECIDRCGRVVTGSEALILRREGNEVTGSAIPGLKRMFSSATGSLDTSKTLSRTIGLHSESPSLASFLGKTPRKQQINVYEPPDMVDIIGLGDGEHKSAVHDFGIPFIVLGKRRREVTNGPENNFDFFVPDPSLSEGQRYANIMGGSSAIAIDGLRSTDASRFYIKRRLVIEDWSRVIPRKQRADADTHKWMLRVAAPSYSPHITTFVSRISVRGVSEIVPSCLDYGAVLWTEEPHFSILGTSHVPFLARITIEWTGGSTRSLEVDHWINLDISGSTTTKLGEEQILDVELDRHMPMKPAILGASLSWNFQASDPPEQLSDREAHSFLQAAAPVSPFPDSKEGEVDPVSSPHQASRPSSAINQSLESFESVLIPLLSRIPLTKEDESFRDALASRIRLPATRKAFLSLIPGRRKAVEWRQAIMLLESFKTYALSDPALSRDDGVASVTAGALYRWMLGRKVFPRDDNERPDSPQDTPAETDSQPMPKLYCASCGLDSSQHLRIKPEGRPADVVPICAEAASHMRIPLVDVRRWMALAKRNLAPAMQRSHRRSESVLAASPGDYVAIAHPRIVEYFHSEAFIRGRMQGYRLGSVQEGTGVFPLERLGSSPDEIDRTMGPIALLAVVFRLFVQDLVKNGINVARTIRAHARSRNSVAATVDDSTVGPAETPQVLTPLHILSVLRGEFESPPRFGAAVCRLGVGEDGLGD